MSASAALRIAAQTPVPELERAHPLTQFCFDALVAGAARPQPGALAFAERLGSSGCEISYADLYQRVGAFLARLQHLDLAPGERILISAAPCAQSFVALAACLAAKLDVALAPLPLPATQHALERAARELKAGALFAPAVFDELEFEEPILKLAAQTPSIRCIGALAGRLDGAADFGPDMMETPLSPQACVVEDWTTEAQHALVGEVNDIGGVRFLSQGVLLGAALDLVRLTRHAASAPIISLCAPSGFGALVAGPLAALIAGAPLYHLAPFDSAWFLHALDALAPVRLVAPAAI
ncbi:MAG: AMP-binding protein, partial [Methylocystis sp.]|nr:AMP-binding protein [Methylocystis sp.]